MPLAPAVRGRACRRGRSPLAGVIVVLAGTLALAQPPNGEPAPADPRKQIEEVRARQQKELEGLDRAVQEALKDRASAPAATGGARPNADTNVRNVPNLRDPRFGKKGRGAGGPLVDDRLGLLVE